MKKRIPFLLSLFFINASTQPGVCCCKETVQGSLYTPTNQNHENQTHASNIPVPATFDICNERPHELTIDIPGPSNELPGSITEEIDNETAVAIQRKLYAAEQSRQAYLEKTAQYYEQHVHNQENEEKSQSGGITPVPIYRGKTPMRSIAQ